MTLYRSGCLAGSQTKPIFCSDVHCTSIQAEHTTSRDVCNAGNSTVVGLPMVCAVITDMMWPFANPSRPLEFSTQLLSSLQHAIMHFMADLRIPNVLMCLAMQIHQLAAARYSQHTINSMCCERHFDVTEYPSESKGSFHIATLMQMQAIDAQAVVARTLAAWWVPGPAPMPCLKNDRHCPVCT